jgi:glutamine synthetase
LDRPARSAPWPTCRQPARSRSFRHRWDRVLDALEADHDFLLAGDVFTSDLIAAYLEHERSEVDEVRRRPHAWELALYFGG